MKASLSQHDRGVFAQLTILGHEIRTSTTIRARSVCALQGEFRWIVTGTPIQIRWEDQASILHFLGAYPKLISKAIAAMILANPSGSALRSVLASLCLRRSKTMLDLPQRTDLIHKLDFNKTEKSAYLRAKEGVIYSIHMAQTSKATGQFSNVLAKINALRQLCNLGLDYKSVSEDLKGGSGENKDVQELFDTMISSGNAKCTLCGDEWSTPTDQDGDVKGQLSEAWPSVTICGILICAGCIPSTNGRSVCEYQNPCPFLQTSMETKSNLPEAALSQHSPVKMRALKTDIVALPKTEKRSVQKGASPQSNAEILPSVVFSF